MADRPQSCDTFVALPPATQGGAVIFGKNSDRPNDEVQEVVYVPAADHAPGEKVQCTYIEIPQVSHTYAVSLSKPSWMWGAEIGVNELGVAIGNEAVWTKLNGPEDNKEKLLGMDLLRLGLERSKSAHEAVGVVSTLLEQHGQGGSCSDGGGAWSYHNSFIMADPTEAWVLECPGSLWAAEKVTSGVRNISNQLTIRTKIDACSENLREFAQSKGWWSPDEGELDFAKVFADGFEETEVAAGKKPCGRQQQGHELLKHYSKEGTFGVADMMRILRDERSGICMTGGFLSTGSQVSMLTPGGPNIHWFTATPNPAQSLYKPFVFCPGASMGEQTKSQDYGADDPRRKSPRFKTTVDRTHPLWGAHEKLVQLLEGGDDAKGNMILSQLRELEEHCVSDMEDVAKNFDDEKTVARVAQIFQHMVDIEMNFYK